MGAKREKENKIRKDSGKLEVRRRAWETDTGERNVELSNSRIVDPKIIFQAQGRRRHEYRVIRRAKIFRDTNYNERRLYEDTDNDSHNGIGFTVYGIRPDDGGATTDAGADERERDANYCAGEGEEDASRTGAS